MKTLVQLSEARAHYRTTKDTLSARANAQTIAKQIITKSDDELREAFRIIHEIITK